MKLTHVVALIACAALVPAAAQAQTSLTGQTIYACYVPKTGTVYRIKVADSPTKCAPNHVAFSWDVAGGTGGGGLTGFRVTGNTVEVAPLGVYGTPVMCNAGEIVVNGGYSVGDVALGALASVIIMQDAPLRDAGADRWGWQVRFANIMPDYSVSLTVFAMCAQVGS